METNASSPARRCWERPSTTPLRSLRTKIRTEHTENRIREAAPLAQNSEQVDRLAQLGLSTPNIEALAGFIGARPAHQSADDIWRALGRAFRVDQVEFQLQRHYRVVGRIPEAPLRYLGDPPLRFRGYPFGFQHLASEVLILEPKGRRPPEPASDGP